MQTDKNREGTGYTPRAPRFPLQVPLRYRESGMMHWREGETLNISRTGILFRSKQGLPLRSVLEMRIVFPAEIVRSSVPTTIACWGPVVRSQLLEFPETRPAFAATIRGYRFLREPAAPRKQN